MDLEVIQKSLLDPRDVEKCLDTATRLATKSVEVAEECHFSLPRKGKNGENQAIEGPSVRFAEILAHSWRNVLVDSKVLEIGDKEVVCQGVFLDLESNVAIRKEVRRSIVGRTGRRFSQDMIHTTANAASSVAFRNAIFSGIPKALWLEAYRAALHKMSRGPLSERRKRAIDWFEARGVSEKQVCDKCGVVNRSELTEQHLKDLTGLRNAISEGALTEAEAFGGGTTKEPPPPLEEPKKAVDLDKLKDWLFEEYGVDKSVDPYSITEPEIVVAIGEKEAELCS